MFMVWLMRLAQPGAAATYDCHFTFSQSVLETTMNTMVHSFSRHHVVHRILLALQSPVPERPAHPDITWARFTFGQPFGRKRALIKGATGSGVPEREISHDEVQGRVFVRNRSSRDLSGDSPELSGALIFH
jgi:hypothetical protein